MFSFSDEYDLAARKRHPFSRVIVIFYNVLLVLKVLEAAKIVSFAFDPQHKKEDKYIILQGLCLSMKVQTLKFVIKKISSSQVQSYHKLKMY